MGKTKHLGLDLVTNKTGNIIPIMRWRPMFLILHLLSLFRILLLDLHCPLSGAERCKHSTRQEKTERWWDIAEWTGIQATSGKLSPCTEWGVVYGGGWGGWSADTTGDLLSLSLTRLCWQPRGEFIIFCAFCFQITMPIPSTSTFTPSPFLGLLSPTLYCNFLHPRQGFQLPVTWGP